MLLEPQALLPTVVLCGVMACGAGCASTRLVSTSVSSAIAVDGDYRDWGGIPLKSLEDEGLAVGIAHDSEYLYLMLLSYELRQARRIRASGVTLRLAHGLGVLRPRELVGACLRDLSIHRREVAPSDDLTIMALSWGEPGKRMAA